MGYMNKIICCFVLSWMVALPSATEAANLVSIMVADTKDSSIGSSVAKDLENMRSQALKIAKYTKLNLKEHNLSGSKTKLAPLKEILKTVEVGKNDVVLFFYAGHGFHLKSKKNSTPWPSMHFSLTGESYDYETVIKTLQKKSPRLLVTVADTCNGLTGREAVFVTRQETITQETDALLRKNYKRLFVEVSGEIKIASSTVGESAWGGSKGGVFTLAFLKNLDEAVLSKKAVSWDTILEKASVITIEKAHKSKAKQHPYYEIALK